MVGTRVEIVAGANAPVAPGAPIELAFDRLLMPLSVTRQSFSLQDLSATPLPPPKVTYDPVARVVTITPKAPASGYRVVIASPASATDPNGLRAIDGATLDPKWTQPITIPVLADAGAPVPIPTVDFCNDILPTFRTTCVGSGCHNGPTPPPAAGLWLNAAKGVLTTALGRAAQGSNSGPSMGTGNAPQPPPLFGLDMPIIDNNGGSSNGGDPGNSWLIYKMLLAVPTAATPARTTHSVSWQPLSDAERATLSNYISGREMPFPGRPSAPVAGGLKVDELELMSFWIAQGANVPTSCP